MKNRFFTLCAALALTAASANAQWTPNDKDYAIVGKDSIYGQSQMKTFRTSDGSIVLTWINKPRDISYKDPSYGYWLYMQVFDPQGNPKLGKNGKAISAHPTRSWTTDYGVQLTKDNKVVMAYSDARNDKTEQTVENYLYCYDLDGNAIWNKDGIKMRTETNHPTYEDLVPTVCISGDNIYTLLNHTESYNVKADSSNWEPNPFFPNDEMPDSVTIGDTEYQLMRVNTDGTEAWTSPLHLKQSTVWLYPANNGNLYVLYVNNGSGLSARLIDKDGKDVWEKPVTVESGCISGGFYTPTPAVESDGEGGLMLVYRKLLSVTGYTVVNRLTPEGSVFADELITNGTTDGDADDPVIAVNGGKTFASFEYKPNGSMYQLWCNQFDNGGDYTLDGDSLLGFSICDNTAYGVTPVKVIPQADGWVVLYGDLLSYSTANFYIEKIGFDGGMLWKKQIGEEKFKSTGFSVAYDDNNAYIFYTCDKEIGPDYKEIPGPGGMRVMCVALNDGGTTGISNTRTVANGKQAIYNAQGVRVDRADAPGLYIIQENGMTKKVIKK